MQGERGSAGLGAVRGRMELRFGDRRGLWKPGRAFAAPSQECWWLPLRKGVGETEGAVSRSGLGG